MTSREPARRRPLRWLALVSVTSALLSGCPASHRAREDGHLDAGPGPAEPPPARPPLDGSLPADGGSDAADSELPVEIAYLAQSTDQPGAPLALYATRLDQAGVARRVSPENRALHASFKKLRYSPTSERLIFVGALDRPADNAYLVASCRNEPCAAPVALLPDLPTRKGEDCRAADAAWSPLGAGVAVELRCELAQTMLLYWIGLDGDNVSAPRLLAEATGSLPFFPRFVEGGRGLLFYQSTMRQLIDLQAPTAGALRLADSVAVSPDGRKGLIKVGGQLHSLDFGQVLDERVIRPTPLDLHDMQNVAATAPSHAIYKTRRMVDGKVSEQAWAVRWDNGRVTPIGGASATPLAVATCGDQVAVAAQGAIPLLARIQAGAGANDLVELRAPALAPGFGDSLSFRRGCSLLAYHSALPGVDERTGNSVSDPWMTVDVPSLAHWMRAGEAGNFNDIFPGQGTFTYRIDDFEPRSVRVSRIEHDGARTQLVQWPAAGFELLTTSRDGRYAYFAADPELRGDVRLYQLNVATGALRQLASALGREPKALLSPDEAKLVLSGNGGANPNTGVAAQDQLLEIDLRSGQARALTSSGTVTWGGVDPDSLASVANRSGALLYTADLERSRSKSLFMWQRDGDSSTKINDEPMHAARDVQLYRVLQEGHGIAYATTAGMRSERLLTSSQLVVSGGAAITPGLRPIALWSEGALLRSGNDLELHYLKLATGTITRLVGLAKPAYFEGIYPTEAPGQPLIFVRESDAQWSYFAGAPDRADDPTPIFGGEQLTRLVSVPGTPFQIARGDWGDGLRVLDSATLALRPISGKDGQPLSDREFELLGMHGQAVLIQQSSGLFLVDLTRPAEARPLHDATASLVATSADYEWAAFCKPGASAETLELAIISMANAEQVTSHSIPVATGESCSSARVALSETGRFVFFADRQQRLLLQADGSAPAQSLAGDVTDSHVTQPFDRAEQHVLDYALEEGKVELHMWQVEAPETPIRVSAERLTLPTQAAAQWVE